VTQRSSAGQFPFLHAYFNLKQYVIIVIVFFLLLVEQLSIIKFLFLPRTENTVSICMTFVQIARLTWQMLDRVQFLICRVHLLSE